jgi:hypothetical protein
MFFAIEAQRLAFRAVAKMLALYFVFLLYGDGVGLLAKVVVMYPFF